MIAVYGHHPSSTPKLLDWVLGKYDPTLYPQTFQHIEANYTMQDGKVYLFHTQAIMAFKKMSEAAKQDGITLLALSTLRNFTY
jgi:LAS superfamily LD-carboxypeptidase LdcB